MRRQRKDRGFTLLEILISMSMFTAIGFAVVLLMKNGVDMWIRGNHGAQQEDRLEQSLPRLEEDLRMVQVPSQRDRRPFDAKNPDPEKEPDPLPPTNRFLSGYHDYRIRDQVYRCRYFAFVREISGLSEIETYVLRAGRNPKAESYIDGKNDEDEFKKNDHLPTGGAVEVLWIWLPDLKRPGVGTVYRAYRSPIGGKGTLLDPANHDELAEVVDKIQPQPMFQDVLLFDAYFWTQYTTKWEFSSGDPTVIKRPTDATALKGRRPPCGPSRIWDSTRGLLPEGGDKGFRLTRGKTSLNFSADDIWPRMVRVEFALAEETNELARGLAPNGQDFTVLTAEFATGRGALEGVLMKIGPEFVEVGRRDGQARDTFLISRRGMRGTTKLDHAEGASVRYGRVFDFTITIPSFRDDNN